MLRLLTVKNFGRFTDYTSLRFDANYNRVKCKEHHIAPGNILRLNSIYGAGGSGKSTFVNAFSIMRDAVLGRKEDWSFKYGVNLLHQDKNVELEIQFDFDGYVYDYALELDKDGMIVYEELVKCISVEELISIDGPIPDDKIHETVLFKWISGENPTMEESVFDESAREYIMHQLHGGTRRYLTSPGESLSHYALINSSNGKLKFPAFEILAGFFKTVSIVNDIASNIIVDWSDTLYRKFFFDLITTFYDHAIRDYRDIIVDGTDVKFKHILYNPETKEDVECIVPLKNESAGFIYLTKLAYAIYQIKVVSPTEQDRKNGAVLMVDNIDGILNSRESRYVRELFTYPFDFIDDNLKFADSNIQLICTANTIPAETYRADEIWIIDNTGTDTEVYSLDQFNLSDYSEDYSVNYRVVNAFNDGRFGGLSRCQDYIVL